MTENLVSGGERVKNVFQGLTLTSTQILESEGMDYLPIQNNMPYILNDNNKAKYQIFSSWNVNDFLNLSSFYTLMHTKRQNKSTIICEKK